MLLQHTFTATEYQQYIPTDHLKNFKEEVVSEVNEVSEGQGGWCDHTVSCSNSLGTTKIWS